MTDVLEQVVAKVEGGERLSRDEGIALFEHPDLTAVGQLARGVKERLSGPYAYFHVNLHINLTNVCAHGCRFCAFSKRKDEGGGYAMSVDDVMTEASRVEGLGATEFHVVSACHPDLPFEYYVEVVRALFSRYPEVHIQAFTAVEIDYFSRISGLTVEEVLRRLKEAGMASLPGGGAEIFSPRVRHSICPEKSTGERWLEIHRAAHRLGLRTNATMLYGHVETFEERVDHLLALRALQDETGGFQAFVPLPFHPDNTRMDAVPRTSAIDDLRTMAVSRLLLDNFPHLKSFWIMLGLDIGQVSLLFGSDDLDGTVVEEKITHAAGARTEVGITKERLVGLIRQAGWVPVQRDTMYNVIQVIGDPA